MKGRAVIIAGLALGACQEAPRAPDGGMHDRRQVPELIGQRIITCADGSRADVDFLADGLTMAVTWLPDGKPERLRAGATGEDYRSADTRAVVADGSIAFTDRNGAVRVCRRDGEG